MEGALRSRVEKWIAADPDPLCRRELEALLDTDDEDELRARFAGKLEFGTAGLRGLIGAGPMRMNRATVARATAGLCDHLTRTVPDAQQRGLCIGFDGRRLSRELAQETAAIAAGAGFHVFRFTQVCPTPLLAFATLARHAAAGVMITASHNPAAYNGYKVYWENGVQIIPPHDAAISRAIDESPGADTLPRGDLAQAPQTLLGEETEAAYLAALPPVRIPSQPAMAYTALHGVGEPLLRRTMQQAGFTQLHSVPEQARPDADFPTVSFPNPEENGAMDRVLALARQVGADLVLANDPDADRLCAGAPDTDGKLRVLSGNDLAMVLMEHVLERGDSGQPRCVLSSIVSSPMAQRVASSHGVHHEATLTGFKWICNRALELEQERGLHFAFGFEEALGYCVAGAVRDKDGISAALAVAELAAELRSRGQTLWHALEAIWRRDGLWISGQISLRLQGDDDTTMRRARQAPPTELAGLRVLETQDLLQADSGLPPANAVFWLLEGGHRVAVRPSGTEPKIKLYFDVTEAVADGEAIAAARARAQQRLESLQRAVQQSLG